jgi:site-specific DNA-methyltransferase (adenine-specific)
VPSSRCIFGDATSAKTYDQSLGSQRADLLLTDPPYCLLTRRRRGGDLRDKRPRKIDREPVVRFETVRDYREFTQAWLPLALERLKPEGMAILWTNFLGQEPLVQVARACGFGELWGEFVWAKRTTERTGNEQLLRVYEVALVLGRTPPPPKAPDTGAVPWSVVAGYDDEGEADRWGAHPHHKPFSSLEPLLRSWSRPGDTVLDPFAGSGSIPVAAQRLGRLPACSELVEEWATRVSERLQEIPRIS